MPNLPHPNNDHLKSTDLHQSQAHPLAKVGWTCPPQSTTWLRPYRYCHRIQTSTWERSWPHRCWKSAVQFRLLLTVHLDRRAATGNILVDTGLTGPSGPSRSFVVDFRPCATLPPGFAKSAMALGSRLRSIYTQVVYFHRVDQSYLSV